MKISKEFVFLKWLCKILPENILTHLYVVGGAPRDFYLDPNLSIKDLDMVIDSLNSFGVTSLDIANIIKNNISGDVSIISDKFLVTHITINSDFTFDDQNLKGQKIEIVTARKESYDKGSHKPTSVEPGTISDDLKRRDFNFNTLVWKLKNIRETGPTKENILDLLGSGKQDLDNKEINTPLSPEETFQDDPSRMLRAVRFSIKYNFKIPNTLRAAIKKMAPEIRKIDAFTLGEIFFGKILTLPKAMDAINLMENLGLMSELISYIGSKKGNETFVSTMIKNSGIKNLNIIFKLFQLGFKGTLFDNLPNEFLNKLEPDIKSKPHDAIISWIEMYKKPPLNYEHLLEITGFKKDQIKTITNYAKQIILDNPYITKNDLDEKVIDHFKNDLS